MTSIIEQDPTLAFDKDRLAALVQPVAEASGSVATGAEVYLANVPVTPEGSGGVF